jgi:hypothetical protein
LYWSGNKFSILQLTPGRWRVGSTGDAKPQFVGTSVHPKTEVDVTVISRLSAKGWTVRVAMPDVGEIFRTQSSLVPPPS